MGPDDGLSLLSSALIGLQRQKVLPVLIRLSEKAVASVIALKVVRDGDPDFSDGCFLSGSPQRRRRKPPEDEG